MNEPAIDLPDANSSSPQSKPCMLAYENPRSVAIEKRQQQSARQRFVIGKIEDNAQSFSIAGSVFFFLIGLGSGNHVDPLVKYFALLMLACMATGLGCCVACISNPMLRRITRKQWLAGLIAIGLSLFLSTMIQSCPHATYFRFGPWLTTISGTACNNTQPHLFWWSLIKH